MSAAVRLLVSAGCCWLAIACTVAMVGRGDGSFGAFALFFVVMAVVVLRTATEHHG